MLDNVEPTGQQVHRNGTSAIPAHGRRPEDQRVIIGLGTDIVEIVRIGRMVERHGELFLNRVYTQGEVSYCQKRKESYQHFAGRWAAKEAVMKTLGTGFVRGIHWRDIEVDSQQSGRPVIRLHGGARDLAEQLGIQEILITISHCRAYATATSIAIGTAVQPETASPPPPDDETQ